MTLAVGGGFGGDYDFGWAGIHVDAREVAGCYLEAVEKCGGLARLDLAGGEGVDDDGERDLNGFAVFECAEMDGLGADDVVGCGFDGAEAVVALVKAGMEETP
jgi:hypothetical protein